ncbi:MAG: biotin/lipoyl-binding protein [Gammaproteobacteria bacterium]|nr:biotin/lipoyl-binding protein [Gammaproteobacteria bacterium]
MADVTPTGINRRINRLMIANRGEIARRILRSAHEMGISTVAVYARGDADEPFVREADLAMPLDGDTALETYLNIDAVLEAAARAEADAVHPGYGFLSENAAFASKVIESGLAWVGPSPEAIAAMGDKIEAKRRMREAGVPTLESIEVTEGADLLPLARDMGFPLLVKASAGGGGKGMRIVTCEADLAQAVISAQREAGSAFGDDRLFIEPYVHPVRHVEVQILGDQHGNLVHLFERECSIQRRHQKIIEEAPSPVVDASTREALGQAALAAGRQIGYHSAGTVEFLYSEGKFWFLEVNTRLQVEHPVTEAVTGVDLVREQIRVAEGERLSFAQDVLHIQGAAIEARLYAEDAANDFLPAAGDVDVWVPAAGVRFDSGIEAGSRVGIEFDPMIAKVIAHAPTRKEAASKLARALRQTRIHGLISNRDFLIAALQHEEFLRGETTTDFLERTKVGERTEGGAKALHGAMIACAVASVKEHRDAAEVLSELRGGWRNSPMPPMRLTFAHEDDAHEIEYRQLRDGRFSCSVGGQHYEVVAHRVDGESFDLGIAGRRSRWHVTHCRDNWYVDGVDASFALKQAPRFPSAVGQERTGAARAPMPGKVLDIRVKAGDEVGAGDLLLTLEAMKMEHQIKAPHDGVVTDLSVQAGDQVANGAVLVVIEEGTESEEAR